MLGKMAGEKRKGSQAIRWLDLITAVMDKLLEKLGTDLSVSKSQH